MAYTNTDEGKSFNTLMTERDSSYTRNKQALTEEQGDIDVWAAEEGVAAAKEASDKSFSALSKLSGGRSVGGGNYSGLLSGRNSINLGSMSGGLAAKNTAALKSAKQTAAANDYYGAQIAADETYNSGRKQTLRATGFTDAQIDAGDAGWSMGIGGFKQRIGPDGTVQTSDANGNFA